MTAVAQLGKTILTPEIEAERRSALRALLRSPLLPAIGETAEEYVIVRRHAAWLQHWLAKFPVWDLHVDNEVARLRKTPSDFADESRPAVDRASGSSFSRRRYALLCLALAALERLERQTTLGKIAESIMEFIAADRALQNAGLVFNISNHDQRRDLVHVVRLLLHFGLLRRIHGDEREFLNRTGASDALYDINRPILSVLLNADRSPSALEAAADGNALMRREAHSVEELASRITDEPQPSTDEERNRSIRSRIVRALLDDPVLYFADLSEEERAYFQKQRGYILRQIREATGLIPEVRFEGIAMVDDTGELTDIKLPEEGTDGHLGLLLAEQLAQFAKTDPGKVIPLRTVSQYVGKLIEDHGSRWRKAIREPGAEGRAAEDAISRLRGLRLVQITADGILPLAAIGRYASGQLPADTEHQE